MNLDDLRLNSIIKSGKEGEIVIVGCPFDFTRKRCINKGGQQNGPCCLRRFYSKVGPLFNPEYEIDISLVNISDFGNISPEKQYQNNPQKIINKISNDIESIINNNQLPFVFGGSKQCSLGCARSFFDKCKEGKLILMSGLPHLKRPYDNDKLTSNNLLTILNNQFPNKQILFGTHSRYLPTQYKKNFQYISFQEILSNKEKSQLDFIGKPAIKLNQLMQQETNFHITLSVEIIQRFNGCRDLNISGFKVEQVTQIFYLLGQKQNVKSVDITQFNPSCEDYQSSLILLNFLYYFLMGWTKRFIV